MAIDVIESARVSELWRDLEWLEAPLTEGESPLTAIAVSGHTEHVVPRASPRLFVGVLRSEHATASGFDLVVSSDEELISLAEATDRCPRAVSILVQLVRASEMLDVGRALLMESLAFSTLLAGGEFDRWNSLRTAATHKPSPMPVLVEDDGAALTVTLNRPEVRNAFDAATRDALVDVLRAAALLPARSIVLRGNGESFCAGGDLTEFGRQDPALAHLIRTARLPGTLIHQMRDRVTARVHGACVGAGIELAAFCGRVSAHPDAVFRLPEIGMGLIPGAGGTVSITRRIGRQRALRLAIGGETINSERALQWRLVDEVQS